MSFRRGVVLLNLTSLHKVIKNGKCHIRAERTRAIAQQQGGVHRLANLAALHNQCRLNALAYTDEVVMYGRDSKERGNESLTPNSLTPGSLTPNSLTPDPSPKGEGSGYFICQNDIVVAIIHGLLCVFAELVKSHPQCFSGLSVYTPLSLRRGVGGEAVRGEAAVAEPESHLQLYCLEPLIPYIT